MLRANNVRWNDLDPLRCCVYNTILSFQVPMTEAVVVHEYDRVDELLKVVCHHWLWKSLVMCLIEQVQQIWSIYQLPLHYLAELF